MLTKNSRYNMSAGVLIKTDGTKEIVNPKNGKDYKLAELQEFVGGYIEIVYLPEGMIMVVNEEGLLDNLPLNGIASRLAGQIIVGDVLVCKSKEVK